VSGVTDDDRTASRGAEQDLDLDRSVALPSAQHDKRMRPEMRAGHLKHKTQ